MCPCESSKFFLFPLDCFLQLLLYYVPSYSWDHSLADASTAHGNQFIGLLREFTDITVELAPDGAGSLRCCMDKQHEPTAFILHMVEFVSLFLQGNSMVEVEDVN